MGASSSSSSSSAIACNDASVTTLKVDYKVCKLIDGELRQMCHELRRNTHVHTLDLTGMQECVGSDGASLIARMLSHNRGITALILADCSFGDEGAIRLASGLSHHSQLKRLELFRNQIDGAAAMTTLLEALAHCPSLTELGLNGNSGIAHMGSMQALIKLLQPGVCSLVTLNVDMCRGLNGPVLRELLHSLRENRQLQDLRLWPTSSAKTMHSRWQRC
jgi:hypothetical protein